MPADSYITEDGYLVSRGDTVRIMDGGGRRHGEGVVTKIGSTLVHIEQYGQVTTFYRNTQQRRDGWPGYFETLQQAADLEQREIATKALRNFGVELHYGSRATWPAKKVAALLEAVRQIQGEVPDA